MGSKRSRRFTEKTIIFAGILKWFILASAIGVLTGLLATGFLKLLYFTIGIAKSYPYYFFALPFILALNGLLSKYILKDAAGEGTDKVIEAVHEKSGEMKWYLIPLKLLGAILTLGSGGSAGKEGPCAEIGGGISSLFSDIFKFTPEERKKLVICGAAAGFATVFGTPIGGAMLGVEILFVGEILYDVLFPAFVSGIISYQISSYFGIQYFQHPVEFIPVFTSFFFLKVLLGGIFFGLVSVFLIEMLRLAKILNRSIQAPDYLKNFTAGLFLAALTLFVSDRFLGLGLNHIQSNLEGGKAGWWVFWLKGVFTSFTLNFGGMGGIVTPIFYMGSSSGAWFAQIFGLDRATFAAIGMASLLAGTTNTPIASSIIAVQLFGSKLGPYAALSCVLSFLITGHTSALSSQILAIRKSSSVEVELGKEFEDMEEIQTLSFKRNLFFRLSYRYFKKVQEFVRAGLQKTKDKS